MHVAKTWRVKVSASVFWHPLSWSELWLCHQVGLCRFMCDKQKVRRCFWRDMVDSSAMKLVPMKTHDLNELED